MTKGFIFNALVDEDAKVQRWAFNALAQLGEGADVPLMIEPWKRSRSDPEVFEAGLTALAHLISKESLMVILASADVELNPSALMALGQQTDDFRDELAALRLDINHANDGELRAATLLIGLKKAPVTLFSGRHPVSDVIGELNTHPDPIVSQYSFWAVVEHPSLGIKNIRVLPNDFSRLPPNVQGWAYRTLTKDGTNAFKHYDAIIKASESRHVEVREGLAIGLRHIYYDSLDIMVADWFTDERDPAVRDGLLEHMAAHVVKSSAYRDEVMRAYREAGNGSVLRSRLEAANREPDVGLEMRKIAFQMSDPDLFASMIGPSMNTQNFNGPVNAGGISNSGPGNIGHVQIITMVEAQAQAKPVLEQLRQALEAHDAPEGCAEGAKIVNEAIAAPTRGTVERVVGWLKNIKEGGDALSGLTTLAVTSYDKLAPLVHHLPNFL